MQTFLVSHLLLHSEHILFPGGFLTSALWESSTLGSCLSSFLPWARALTSWYGQCWAYCLMPLLHFPLESNYNRRHRFKLRTSRPCKAGSRLFLLLFRTLYSPMLTTWFFFRRKSRFCSAWESLCSGRVTTFILRSHWSTGHHPKSTIFYPENNPSIIEISFLETRGVLCWSA